MATANLVERFRRELRRIGLDEESSPYGVMASGSEEAVVEFLAHVSSLPVGATWRDVYPDIPKHWDLANEETWTSAYRPLGPFDYPTLPCGPAVLIRLPRGSTEDALAQLAAAADLKGWVVYGSGFVPIENPDWPDRLAYVVLDLSTTEPQYYEFALWVESRPAVTLAGCTRPVGTQFAPEPGT